VLDGLPKTLQQAKDIFGQGEEVDSTILPGAPSLAFTGPLLASHA
jgi:hypothetical protein